MYNILCFDTSNNMCSVAVAYGKDILSYEQETKPAAQAERLMLLIESALQKAHLSYRDIQYVAVTTGPGSFTGIRISLAAAKGIIHTTNAVSVAVNNFECYLYTLYKQVYDPGVVMILINAYRQQQYVQVYDRNKQPVMQPRLANNDDIADLIKYYGVNTCAGSGLLPVYHDLAKIKDLMLLPMFSVVKAIHITKIAAEKIDNNMISPIVPLYIRLPDATPAV